ncbi:MAG: arabinan endo-1,5-alpha-L-arabinosidase [Steroidobacteraceae bacterium]
MLSRRQMMGGSLGGLAALAFGAGSAQTLPALNPKLTGDLYPVHDPCIIKAGGTFYLFCTTPRADKPAQIPWRRSRDLLHWEKAGHVFAELPAWAHAAVPHAQTLWAPDISFFDGQYYLYYACSTFGSNRSVIGLATNTTLDPAESGYRWQDRGLVLESHPGDDFNALDPNRIGERSGRHWLAFGSFWSGLKLIELDPKSGLPLPAAKRHDLARRPKPPDAIEAAFVIERAGNYYLFASFDFCCRGAQSTYYTVVGRAPQILGPYVDQRGVPMLAGGGTLVLAAASDDTRWRGPGHVAILRDAGKDYIVYHAYDADHDGRPTLRIAPLGWTESDWPVAFV